MTAVEMLNEFRTGYDEAMSFAAPQLDHYDVSVFLTRAQEAVLKRRLRPSGNKYGETFDQTEKRKRDFDELLETASINSLSVVQSDAVPNGRVFNLPEDHMLTVMERADLKLKVPDPCYPGNMVYNVLVKPISYDTYMSNKDNPFRKPDKTTVWRLVKSRVDQTLPISATNPKRQELISDGTYHVDLYHITYLRRPYPIVTGALPVGMSIEGVSTQTDCRLDPILHREIVSEAVRMASGTMRDQGYQADALESNLSE